MSQSWVADLIPVAGGKGHMLGMVTGAEGDPESAAAIVSAPAARRHIIAGWCFSPQPGPDRAVELREPGQAARTLITAAELNGALGWPRGTPVVLTALRVPAEAGWRCASCWTPRRSQGGPSARQAMVVITRTGRILAKMPLPAAGRMQWSPDGQRIAICRASQHAPSSVTVWTVGGAVRTIALPGRHDVACNQLLWSPDGSQLIYAAWATTGA